MASDNYRNFNLDLIRVVACIAVIYLHVSARPIYLQGQISDTSWFVANALSSLSHWCVPAFVMLSGALLLGRERSWGVAYKKRIPRLLLVTVIMTFVYAFWRVYFHNEVIFPVFWKELVIGGAYYHLYYLYVAVGLYAITPIAAHTVGHLSKEQLRSTSLALCLITSFSFSFSSFTGTYQPNASTFAWPFLSYFVLGFYLYKYPISVRIGLAVASIGYLTTLLGTQYLAIANGPEWTWRLYFYTYFSPNTFLMSIGMFSMLLSVRNYEAQSLTKNLAHSLSRLTLLVYLLHPMVMESLRRIYALYAPQLMDLRVELPLTLLMTSLFTFLIAYSLKKIPGISNVF